MIEFQPLIDGLELPNAPEDDSDCDGAMFSRLGQVAELRLMAEATERGFAVLAPMTHDTSADVALWLPPNRPITVQVKTVGLHHGVWVVRISSNRGSRMKRGLQQTKYRHYKRGDFDVLAAWFREVGSWGFWSWDEIDGRKRINVTDHRYGHGGWDVVFRACQSPVSVYSSTAHIYPQSNTEH